MIVTIRIGRLSRQFRLSQELPVRRQSVTVACTACGAVNSTRNFYCGNCGKPLGRR